MDPRKTNVAQRCQQSCSHFSLVCRVRQAAVTIFHGRNFFGLAIVALEAHTAPRTVASPTPVLLISTKGALRRFPSLGARSLRI
jgi:hypothetical protein